MSEPKGLKSRQLALEVLLAVDLRKAYANIALNAAFKRTELSARDRAFVTALVQGVLRKLISLDDTIKKFSTRPLEKMPAPLRNILRMAIFQLQEMPDIPSSAVVNTSTELAKVTGHKGLAQFVNGLLRNYIRTGTAEEPADLSVKYSSPAWLVERWRKNYGEKDAEELLKFFDAPPQIVLRTCELSITTDGLQDILTAKGIKSHRGKLVPSCLILESRKGSRGSPEKLPGFEEGLFTVQDESAALVSLVVDPKPKEVVVDLCAAPGGKSLHLGELAENTGKIIAVDSHANRLEMLKKSRRRLGLTNIEVKAADGREFSLPEGADKVLLDAPCSGTGVLNRRSDLRHQKDPADIAKLVQLQRELLNNAATLLKPGGILVYSTCSIEPEENVENIRSFLDEHKEFEEDDLTPYVPGEFLKDATSRAMIQLLPSRHGVSGFFIARLRKKINSH